MTATTDPRAVEAANFRMFVGGDWVSSVTDRPGGLGPATGGDLAHGSLFEVTAFTNVRRMDRIGQEEIVGPVLSAIPVDDFDAAVIALDQTRCGLASSTFTRDVNRVLCSARGVHAGIVYVNAGTIGAETNLPSGRVKRTGNRHREAGQAALGTHAGWPSVYVDVSGTLQRARIDDQPGVAGR